MFAARGLLGRSTPCAVFALAWVAVGCGRERPATQTIVVLHADPAIANEASSVRVEVFGDDRATLLDRTKATGAGDAELARIPLVPREGDASRRFLVVADLLDASSRILAHVEARSGYVEHELRQLDVWFDDACRGVSCGEGRTCDRGRCVGSCFEAGAPEPGRRSTPRCGECETCETTCVAATGIACGCPGETCNQGQCNPLTKIEHVAAGFVHTCAAREDGQTYCWGSTEFPSPPGGHGRLGTGPSGRDSARPASVEGALGRMGIGAGPNHTVTIDVDARYRWGFNYLGELGGAPDIGVQTTPLEDREFVPGSITSGFNHVCGLYPHTGELFCWGSNAQGNLGLGHIDEAVSQPTLVGAGYASVAAGGDHTCAVRTDGTLVCWGLNNSGELGAPVGVNSSVAILPGCDRSNSGNACFHDYRYVGVGYFHSCGIREGGGLHCWGGNRNGQLGVGPPTADFNRFEPLAVAPGMAWTQVAGGRSHTCALDRAGVLYCWGLNAEGQVGTGAQALVAVPTRVESNAADHFRTIALGDAHSCAIRVDKTLWCWGRNKEGQIGVGTASDAPVSTPRRVCF